MLRRILIIDDHDDLASALKEVFSQVGHEVVTLESHIEALRIDNIESFDVVISDLEVDTTVNEHYSNGHRPACLPEFLTNCDDRVKVFKISASNFRRDEFDESELRELIDTILNYKIKFVDKDVECMHETIEFELPSSIAIMHSILDYLMKRVEKLGVIKAEQSNLFVALDEAFVNAVKHGNKFDVRKHVRIAAEVSSQEARFIIEDEGEGFDVNAIPDPLDPDNLFKSSGRGVLFIYNIMDEVKYNERGNRLTMIKKSQIPEFRPDVENHQIR